MNQTDSRMAAEAVCHAAELSRLAITETAYAMGLPSAVFRPRLFIDGTQWCALYGEDIQSGVAGFGKSPGAAMFDFDVNWSKAL